MTAPGLDAIAALYGNTTPEPWQVLPTRTGAYVMTDRRFSGSRLADFDRQEDAEFAARAHADIPHLIGEIRRLQDENDRLAPDRAEFLRQFIADALERLGGDNPLGDKFASRILRAFLEGVAASIDGPEEVPA